MGDDQRSTVRQHIGPWAKCGTRRPTPRWARGSIPARSRNTRQLQFLQSQAAPDVRPGPGGRIIFFEGTYTTTFSGNPDPTPRYDYNQVMYQLDFVGPAAGTPVPIYQLPGNALAPVQLRTEKPASDGLATAARRVAFFAPDRQGVATLPVFEGNDPVRVRVCGWDQPEPAKPAGTACASFCRPISKTIRRQRYRFTSFMPREGPQGSIRPSCGPPEGERGLDVKTAGAGLEKPGEHLLVRQVLIVRGRFGGAVGVLFLGQVLAGQSRRARCAGSP